MYRLNAEQQSIVDRATEIAERVIKPNARAADAEGRYPARVDGRARRGRPARAHDRERARRHGAGPARGVRGARRGGAALRLDRDVLQHAPGRDRRLSGGDAARRSSSCARPRAASTSATLAFSEFGSRSHFWALVSQERRNGDRVVLDAHKSFVTSAGEADGYVVSTRWSEGKAPTESMLYLVLRERRRA